MNSIYTYPLDIHGLISGNNGESDLVTNIAALSVVKLSWERSRLLVVFLGECDLVLVELLLFKLARTK